MPNTELIVGTMRIEAGSYAKVAGPNIATIRFDKPFATPPVVVTTPFSLVAGFAEVETITQVTATEFSAKSRNGDPQYRINWMAIGERLG
jgi:hypothetical protein